MLKVDSELISSPFLYACKLDRMIAYGWLTSSESPYSVINNLKATADLKSVLRDMLSLTIFRLHSTLVLYKINKDTNKITEQILTRETAESLYESL